MAKKEKPTDPIYDALGPSPTFGMPPLSPSPSFNVGSNAASSATRLARIVSRIRVLNAQIRDLNHEKSRNYAEARNLGYDTAATKAALKALDTDPLVLQEREGKQQIYRAALRAALDLIESEEAADGAEE